MNSVWFVAAFWSLLFADCWMYQKLKTLRLYHEVALTMEDAIHEMVCEKMFLLRDWYVVVDILYFVSWCVYSLTHSAAWLVYLLGPLWLVLNFLFIRTIKCNRRTGLRQRAKNLVSSLKTVRRLVPIRNGA